jgi:hypothetical protein
MSKQPLPSSVPVVEPSCEGDSGERMEVLRTVDDSRARRLRNRLILANLAAWLIIIAAIKWFAF